MISVVKLNQQIDVRKESRVKNVSLKSDNRVYKNLLSVNDLFSTPGEIFYAR